MPLKIVRNDITKMQTQAIVNTANDHPTVGTGCDYAIYKAAGYEQLLDYRKKEIGFIPEGDVFITPGFHLTCKYIIHAVSPFYQGGQAGEEEKLRSCYRKSLELANEHAVTSISFPLISTGGFGYPKEEGFRIAVDEISAFLMTHEMEVYLVVFDEKAARIGKNLSASLEEYIDQNYVEERKDEEYFGIKDYRVIAEEHVNATARAEYVSESVNPVYRKNRNYPGKPEKQLLGEANTLRIRARKDTGSLSDAIQPSNHAPADFDYTGHERALQERIKHISDTFSECLMYLIELKGMSYPDVYKRAIIDKKVFSKIKNNPDYHPKKITAMCLCVGVQLNLDQSRDLLARAGYALSPCDKTDIIFSYFIENEIYDMIELDIQLEEMGLPCLIS